VGPVALNNGPRVDRGPVASSSVVENQVESPTTAVPTSAPTTTVTTTVPSIVPDIEITTTIPGDEAQTEPSRQGNGGGSGDSSKSASTESNDHSGDSADGTSPEKSGDDDKSNDKTDDSSHHSDSEDGPSIPVPGPLTKSINEGSATVDLGPNGLFIVDITPSAGMTFKVKTKPDKIEIQFHDLVSGSDSSDLEFRLVDNGITVKVSHPD